MANVPIITGKCLPINPGIIDVAEIPIDSIIPEFLSTPIIQPAANKIPTIKTTSFAWAFICSSCSFMDLKLLIKAMTKPTIKMR